MRVDWRNLASTTASIGLSLARQCHSRTTILEPNKSSLATLGKSNSSSGTRWVHGSVSHQWRCTSRRYMPSAERPPLRMSSRQAAVKSPFRKAAIKAEHLQDCSRALDQSDSHDNGGRRTKRVVAYCAAERYDMKSVSQILHGLDYSIDPYETGMSHQVIHINLASSTPSASARSYTGVPTGDLFVFASGSVVAWDISDGAVLGLITEHLLPSATNPHKLEIETEDLGFWEDTERATSNIDGEVIRLGVKQTIRLGVDSGGNQQQSELRSGVKESNPQNASFKSHHADLVLAKMAFSSGLARSTKLAVLESALDHYFESTRDIPLLLSKGAKLPFTRSFMLRKTGELLWVRARLNLYSELTDSLPDLFWDSRHDLGLETYFEQVGKALDADVRIRILNERVDYAQEIATVLRERLSEKHGEVLEWSIIVLISIEVFFEISRTYRESRADHDPDSTASLTRRFLKQQLGEHSE